MAGFQKMRNTAGKFHHFDTAHYFAFGVRKHLAMLACNQGRQLVMILFQQFLELEHDAGATQWGSLGPVWKCGPCGSDGFIYFLYGCQRNVGDNFAGGWIEDVGITLGAAGRGGAGNEMIDLRDAHYLSRLPGCGYLVSLSASRTVLNMRSISSGCTISGGEKARISPV